MKAAEKILTLEQVDVWMEEQRAAGLRVGFTCGAFDVMHAGHAQYLAEAQSLCDRLLVAVNSDASIQRYKNPLRPINPWSERAFVVASLACADAVTVLDEDRPLPLILRWKPDLYIKGGDYASSSLRSAAAVEAYGGRAVVIPVQFGTSTTAMFERIQALALHAKPEDAGATGKPRGLVLLDRDGTLVKDACFEPLQIELLPGVIDGLRELQQSGYKLCLVSNQQGIGLGYFGYRDFIDGNQKLLRELGRAGISIAKVYFCPHSMADSCDCRKPQPGMLLRAMREQGVDASHCFVIGDSRQDVEAAERAGCRAYYVGKPQAGLDPMAFAAAARRIVDEGNNAK